MMKKYICKSYHISIKKVIKSILKSANYNYINEDGFISEGVYIPKGQKVVIVGMLSEKYVYKQVKKGVFTELVKEVIYTDYQ